MEPRIEILAPKLLVGKRITMSFANNRTAELWGSFMPRRREVVNIVGSDLYSVQVYGADFSFMQFNPNVFFEKWAAIEVNDSGTIPEGLELFKLTGGQYAVFSYKGAASQGGKMFEYIFTEWLPSSPFLLDSRPHFEKLGEKYKNEHPDSEEEIWIPIKRGE